MAKVEEQAILGMGLPLEMLLREGVDLFELRLGNLHHSTSHLMRGETVTVEEIALHGNCEDVFKAGKIRRDGKIYWAPVRELEKSAFDKVV